VSEALPRLRSACPERSRKLPVDPTAVVAEKNLSISWTPTPTCEEFLVAQGTVKWFNSQKGFGFIQPDGGGNDVFVHISAVERAGLSNLGEGQKISFETETGRNGKASAVNLKVL
jgi:cold shock protein